MSGDWKQHQMWDGTYTFDDLLDWHEMAIVKSENQERYKIFQETK